MQDAFGRTISYLRLSITKACGSRCIYCRPGGLALEQGEDLLTPEEIETLARHLVTNHGLTKLRLTGGEPTTRPDLLEIVQRLAHIQGLADLAMTTNAQTLPRQAKALKEAGLKRVNISLDSLDREKYQRITGIDGLPRALAGIQAAVAAGLTPVKLNTVVIRGENDHELPEMLLFAINRGLEIRFIELMPLGPLASKWDKRFVSESEIRQKLDELVTTWRPSPPGNSAARRYRAGLPLGRRGAVGFVTAMSCPFCEHCNRIRVACDGTYYPCLMDKPAGNILQALRPKLDASLLDQLLQKGLDQKAAEHPPTGQAVMVHIGG
jgi:cyclic pyranopterin phosphate synthase